MGLTCLVIDDHELFRDGLRTLLGGARIQVIGEASDARAAVQLVRTTPADVVLIDVGLPGRNGIALARDLGRDAPGARMLMLTMQSAHEFVVQAFAAGAAGYALKDQPAREVIDAIQHVAAGQRYLAPRLPRTLLAPSNAARGGVLSTLSPREQEVFDLAVRGYSSQGIAAQLGIRLKTVETHRAHINKKLCVHSSAELTRFAARHGLVCE